MRGFYSLVLCPEDVEQLRDRLAGDVVDRGDRFLDHRGGLHYVCWLDHGSGLDYVC
jgi:hypothetical protein